MLRFLDNGNLAVQHSEKWCVYDLAFLQVAEKRIDDIARVTPGTAPELLATFNKAYLDVDRIVKDLATKCTTATDAVRKVKAKILLDDADEILKAKGIKPSADLRQAIVDQNDEYNAALDRQHAIEAAIEYLAGKQKAIEMAYGSVRKILGGSQYTYKNPNLTNGIRGD